MTAGSGSRQTTSPGRGTSAEAGDSGRGSLLNPSGLTEQILKWFVVGYNGINDSLGLLP